MIAIYLLIFIIGLVIGSFLNVVILRTISGESIVFPGSKCPNCQTPLKWYHNIPIFSYIFLKGKCAFCNNHISIQYPIVELLTGIAFLSLGYLYLNNIFNDQLSAPVLVIMFIFTALASSLFIVISGTDFKEMMVSDYHTYSLMFSGILYSAIIGSISFFPDLKFGFANWEALFKPVGFTVASIILAFIIMEILRRGFNWILKLETFGDGDSYIYAGVAGIITAIYGVVSFTNLIIELGIILAASAAVSVVFTFPAYIKQLVLNRKWSLLFVMIAFIVYAPLYFYLGTNTLISNTYTLIACTVGLIILGLLLCFLVISGIKNNKSGAMQIPFGPSLCLTGFIALAMFPVMLGII